MNWLDVPHQPQLEPGWCLPACVAMVTAYLQHPLYQGDVARWLGTEEAGTPASYVQRLTQRGFQVFYRKGTLSQLEDYLLRLSPPILFIRTGELYYWNVDTPHAVVLGGLEGDKAYLFDPGIETAPVTVSVDELMLAWDYFDYMLAVLKA